VGLSLLLGRGRSHPQLGALEQETQLPQWQRWVGYHDSISHDTFGYTAARMNPEPIAPAAVFINRRLKRGKGFEASKLHGPAGGQPDANEAVLAATTAAARTA